MLGFKNIICGLCPNGCALSVDESDDFEIEIKGNRCVLAKQFIVQQIVALGGDVDNFQIISHEEDDPFSFEQIAAIFQCWGFELKKIHSKLFIQGSPERSEYRVVVENTQGQWFVLEQIITAAREKKQRIINVLAALKQKQQPFVEPYCISTQGEAIIESDSGLWQLSAFIRGEGLDREQYLYEAWRASQMALFLVGLQSRSDEIFDFVDEPPFELKTYILHLVQQIRKHHSDLMPALVPIIAFCEDVLFKKIDEIPMTFCHGDFHAMNIIWGENQIKAVIDWEFCGFKPEIYDVCNMIGCLGMEHPSSLSRELVLDFISILREQSTIKANSWELLIDFIVGLRFAWLSEWLRKEDQEMIELELDYMNLLIENKQALLELWGIKDVTSERI